VDSNRTVLTVHSVFEILGSVRRRGNRGSKIYLGYRDLESCLIGPRRACLDLNHQHYRTHRRVSSVQGALPGSFRRSTHGSLMSPSDPKRTSPQRRLLMACPGRRPRTQIGLCHRAGRRVPRHAGDPLLQSGLPPPVAYCQGAGPFPRQCSGNLSDRVLHDGGQLRLE
jgi:hypothetical protein